jgi:hypothetical protein
MVEVVVRLFVRWVLGSFIFSRVLVLSRLSRWGDVFSRQNLILQNETHSFCKTRHASQKKCRVLRDSASFAKLCKTSVSERQQAPK